MQLPLSPFSAPQRRRGPDSGSFGCRNLRLNSASRRHTKNAGHACTYRDIEYGSDTSAYQLKSEIESDMTICAGKNGLTQAPRRMDSVLLDAAPFSFMPICLRPVKSQHAK